MSTPTAQLLLPLSGEDKARPVAPKRKVKPHHRPKADGPLLPLIQPTLPVKDRYFLPLAGVPKTRADCPPSSEYCRHIRCRYHLAMVDAEHRAGRPGVQLVPRDERGLTVSAPGDALLLWLDKIKSGEFSIAAENGRAGTTFNPRWLELERHCKVFVERDDDGRFVTLHAVYENEWEHFRERLHMGEAIDVLVDGVRVGGARMTPDGLALDHEPQWFMATLQRVRGVNSCALDLIEKHGSMTNQEIGDALGRHRTLVAREVRNAAVKLREAGVDLRDLIGDGDDG